jgi:hypothetical protein
MLEKMKAINNPLTIIGLFCGVVEVAGLIVMGTGNLAPEAQRDLIWLVKWFPILLVSLFFVTLWFKDRVLYAPGDFKDEQNYLALASANAKQGLAIETIQLMLSEARTEIINEVVKTVSTSGTEEKRRIEEVVNDKLDPVQSFAGKLKEGIDAEIWWQSRHSDRREAADVIWQLLNSESTPMTLKEIASRLNLNEHIVGLVLYTFICINIVKQNPDEGNGKTYSVANPVNVHFVDPSYKIPAKAIFQYRPPSK